MHAPAVYDEELGGEVCIQCLMPAEGHDATIGGTYCNLRAEATALRVSLIYSFASRRVRHAVRSLLGPP